MDFEGSSEESLEYKDFAGSLQLMCNSQFTVGKEST